MPTEADAYQRLTRALDAHRGDAEAYRRLGEQMTARRHALGARFGNRQLFVRERLVPLGLKESAARKLAYDLERGELQGRDGFSAGSMLALADAYGVTTDAIIAVLDGGRLGPVQPPPPRAATAADAILREVRGGPLLDMAPAMARKVDEHLAEIAVLAADALTRNPGTPIPAGAQVFGPGTFEGQRWDNLLELGHQMDYYQAGGFGLSNMVELAALARVRDDERRQARGSAAAGR